MSDTESVGYGKPPKHTRFKKGQSGNPKGRPKKSRSRANLMDEELDQSITVKEGKNTVTMTKREAVLKQVVNKAVKGDHRAAKLVLEHLGDSLNIEPDADTSKPLSTNEKSILKGFLSKQQKQDHD